MPIGQADYEISVKDNVDLNGLKALLAQLEADTAAAQRMGISVKGAADEIAATKAAISGYEAAARKAQQELGKLDVTHREVHQAMRLVSQAAGGAIGPIGELTHLLGNPYIMAAAGATLAIKMLIEQHQALHDQAVKNIEVSRDLQRALEEAGNEAMRTQAQRVSELTDHFSRLGEKTDLATEAMKRFLTINAETLASVQSALSATENLTEAYIKEQVVLGHFDENEGDFMIRQAKRNEEIASEKAKEDEEVAAAKLKTKRAGEAKQEGEAAKAKAFDLEKEGGARDQAQAAVNKLQSHIEVLQKAQPDLDRAAADATANLPQLEKRAKMFGTPDAANDTPEGFAAASAAQNALADAKRKIKAADDQQAAIEKARNTKGRAEMVLADTVREIDSQTAKADSRFEEARTLTLDAQDITDKVGNEGTAFGKKLGIKDETNRVNRKTAIEKKIMDGTATPGDLAEYGGMTDTKHPGQRDASGRQQTPEGDLANIAGKAKTLYDKLAHERPGDRSPGDLATLHNYLDALIGFSENQNAHVRTLAERQQNQEGRIAELLAQQQNISQRIIYGAYPQ